MFTFKLEAKLNLHLSMTSLSTAEVCINWEMEVNLYYPNIIVNKETEKNRLHFYLDNITYVLLKIILIILS